MSNQRKRVVITGMGTINPLGLSMAASWQAIMRSASGIELISLFDTTAHTVKIAGEVKGFDAVERYGKKDARHMDRFVQFALGAAQEAMLASGLKVDAGNADRIGALIGTGMGGISTVGAEAQTLSARGAGRISPFMVPMMLPDTAAGQIALHFGLRGPNLAVSAACASSTNAIGEAAEMIRRGAADVMLSGGAEAALTPLIMAGFANMGTLSTKSTDPHSASRPFDKQRDGFVAAEGAAVLVLEDAAHATARGAQILGEVLGYGLTNDAFHMTAPASDGASAARCMQLALDNAGLLARDIDYLNAHGTSTILNDNMETLAIKKVFGESAPNLAVSSTKSMHGHLLGAAGALEACIAVQAILHAMLPPTINYEHPDAQCDLDVVPNKARAAPVRRAMSNSFGFGGHNACLILGAFANGRS